MLVASSAGARKLTKSPGYPTAPIGRLGDAPEGLHRDRKAGTQPTGALGDQLETVGSPSVNVASSSR